MILTVAVVGRAHGLRGEVRLDVRTDDPVARLAPGTALETVPADAGPLTVAKARHAPDGSTYVTFEEAHDRSAAEALRGVQLVVETDELDAAEDDAWYPHELIGLSAVTVDGEALGEVTGVDASPAHDLLVIRPATGGPTVLVPFVAEIVPAVDDSAGTVTIDPPGGLFPGIGSAEVDEEPLAQAEREN
ncbi:ribosome maturation factor RimM [Bogoriella caseilytica]|uniref:Ribosome maturation factor RimM n=1 Tax=Bogoriella caseilytica TaxID=56055 RepID=A0A3N2BFG9_9MICO|nr:ribosome maturation factor RimM [Bogoriella caseilytica]ROR73988.1 16S rRNA processing protein RimM [Bogoriella caseilytica]